MTVTIFKVFLVCKIKTTVLVFLSKIVPNVFYIYNIESLSWALIYAYFFINTNHLVLDQFL